MWSFVLNGKSHAGEKFRGSSDFIVMLEKVSRFCFDKSENNFLLTHNGTYKIRREKFRGLLKIRSFSPM